MNEDEDFRCGCCGDLLEGDFLYCSEECYRQDNPPDPPEPMSDAEWKANCERFCP